MTRIEQRPQAERRLGWLAAHLGLRQCGQEAARPLPDPHPAWAG